ncbi:MAG: hypothetical protein Kow0097_00850 [Candidatus Bipolaricaulota bacterium]|nr:hypothetical protein [Candidatus Bipolaricaulota bacterium]
MRRFLLLCCSVFVAGTWVEAAATLALWGTILTLYPVVAGVDPAPSGDGSVPAVLRWPTVLDMAPELRGSTPPVQLFALPTLEVDELDWLLSFREVLGDGGVRRGAVHLALGPQGAVTVSAGTFAGVDLTTYSANWRGTSHRGEAW